MNNALVLGGTHDHITLINELKARGYRAILVDYHHTPPAAAYADEHIRESTLDRERVLALARKNRVRLTISLCIDQALLTSAFVSEQMGTPCYLNYQRALWLTNKIHMKTIMHRWAIPTAPFQLLEKPDDTHPDIAFALPWVFKPADANSSKGITKVTDAALAGIAITEARSQSQTGGVILEQFLEGTEYSADFFMRDYHPLLLLTTRYTKSPARDDRFLICRSIFPSGLASETEAALSGIAARIARAFAIAHGPLFIQFLVKDSRIFIVEFSSRIGGGSKHHFMKMVTGFDYLRHLVDFSLGKNAPISLKPAARHVAINYVYCRKGVLGNFSFFDRLLDDGLICAYYPYKSPGMEIAGALSSADRALGFVVAAPTTDSLHTRTGEVDSLAQIPDQTGRDIMLHGLYLKGDTP